MGKLEFPSEIGLGTWQFCQAVPGLPTPVEAEAIFKEAYARGVRHVDTAQSYGDGRSEEVLGPILEGFDDVFVATKIHYKATVDETLDAVRTSLRRLRRESIDLLYLHWPRKGLDVRPVMEGLERARSLGYIRFVGASNFSVADFTSASEVSKVDAHQIGYSLLWRYPERDVFPYCREQNIETVCYGALAQGLLAGKIHDPSKFRPEDPRLKTVYYDADVFPHVQAAIAELSALAAAEGLTLAGAALAWVLGRPGIAASLLGAKSPAQIAECLSDGADAFRGLAEKHRALMSRLGAVSEAVMSVIPDVGNIFRANP